jgi:hypothetical protein
VSHWKTLPPNEQASNPDTPTDRLRFLAHFHPGEVLQNPILPLLFLEDPANASELVSEAQKNLAEQTLGALLVKTTEPIRRLWLCDCAERLSEFYEVHRPGERRPLEALVLARAYVDGRCGVVDLIRANAEANAAGQPSPRFVGESLPSQAERVTRELAVVFGRVASRRLLVADALDTAQALVGLAAKAALLYSELDPAAAMSIRISEMQWQVLRLEALLTGG